MTNRVLGIINRKIIKNTLTTNNNQGQNDPLELNLNWFKNSLRKEGGSSAKYSLIDKCFYPSYPETTGYWINTLFLVRDNFPAVFDKVFSDRQIEKELAAWLLNVQRSDGAFPGSYGNFSNQAPRVFNTGQIILGLLDHYTRSKDEKVLEAVLKAADWMVKVQSEDGAWRQFTSLQHSSNTRSAWGLIMLGQMLNEHKYLQAGTKNIDFAISLQNNVGYYTKNGFDEKAVPYTHTIAYAINGVFEAGILLKNEAWINSAIKSFEPLVKLIDVKSGFLAGQIDEHYKPAHNYCCLTGNCQLAIIAFKIYDLKKDVRYLEIGRKLLQFVKQKQLVSKNVSINGGIPGSWPVDGHYNPYEIPNWSGKFFVDALILEQNPSLKIYS